MRRLFAFATGLLVALAAAGLPASASNTSIAAVDFTSWNPADVTIHAGDDVTWANGTGLPHNVCVASAGAASGCGEFRSGDPSAAWPSGGYTHRFAAAGSFKYICEQHPGMTGTITVTSDSTSTGTGTGTGTGTSTTPPPDTQPTDTITVPTQTETTPLAADTTAPAFVGKPKRRASRKALIVELRASEAGSLKATVFRRPPRGRSFARVSEASLHVVQGKNVVKLPRTSVRSGSYRVTLQLVDAAGNKSAAKTLRFKVA